ncbi:uncharacterized protein SCHCODRAFT_02752030 [Schizophyllum commune H4-8]|uniref:Myb/SANT-like domain-containing protein n=1 Tax=Schizophyllum commune (strain H4-8 / FGSC 9210) TaxID=578458 RepID=D8QFD7_SCHCM|nr:uncharacterized protein SCHCODRAFT_02752030 [Schizophyllum commune H4-8]KAI5887603.1 hypothetical protein SCHCODRAFT_02752030 [Schizophyllum commune H4-8]
MANKSKIKKDKRKAERRAGSESSGSEADEKAQNASWNATEEQHMYNYLWEHRAEAGHGGNFPDTVYSSCARAIASYRTQGIVKGGRHVHTKYREGRTNTLVIREIKRKSGWSYSEERGADIDSDNEMQKELWTAFLDKLSASHRTAANRFKHKGWPYFDTMDQLVPKTTRGKRAVYGGRGRRPRSPSPAPSEGNATAGADLTQNSVGEGGSGGNAGGNVPPPDSENTADEPHAASQAPRPTTPPPTASPAPMTPSSARVGDKRVPSSPSAEKHPEKKPKAELPAGTSASRRESSFGSTTGGKFTAPAAMMAISQSLDRHGENVRAGLEFRPHASIAATPKRLQDASKRAQELEEGWLTKGEMIDLLDIFIDNVRMADAYMALNHDDTELRQTWVRKRLGKPQPVHAAEEDDPFA